jgi:hypothetical protein
MTPNQKAAIEGAMQRAMTPNEEAMCAASIADPEARVTHPIATLISSCRTRPSSAIIGNGTVLEVLGIDVGNAFLDTINNAAAYRYVKPLVTDGRLQIAKPLVQASIQAMVPAVLTQAQADQLCALGKEPWPITDAEVVGMIFNFDGSDI